MKNYADLMKTASQISWDKVCLPTGILLFILSCSDISYGEQFYFSLKWPPNWAFLVVGILLIFIPIIWNVRFSIPGSQYVKKTKGGFRISLPDSKHKISVMFGTIQHFGAISRDEAVVLPSNICFDDECINDPKTALGAFAKEHFKNAYERVQRIIHEELQKKYPDHSGSEFPPGATIFLDNPLGTDRRVIFAAATRIPSDKEPIKGDTQLLLTAIKSILKGAAIQRWNNIFIPVMGTGKGGLDFSISLILTLLQTIHCIRKEGVHHIESVSIVVSDPEKRLRKQVENIVRSMASIL